MIENLMRRLASNLAPHSERVEGGEVVQEQIQEFQDRHRPHPLAAPPSAEQDDIHQHRARSR
jgi:hypothetical protein